MRRRRYLTGAGGAALAALAGCLDELGNGDENGDQEPHGAVAAVEAYVEAGREGDEERMSELAYDDSPVDPEWAERMLEESDDEWELQDEDDELTVEDVEIDLLEEDVDLAAVDHVQHLEFWLEDDALELIDGDGTALVRTTWTDTDPDGFGVPDELEEENHWVLYTEDDEWRILWQGEPHGTPDDFEDPVADEDGRLVESIEYDVQEVDEEFAEFHDGDEIHMAEVSMVDDPDPDIDGARVESTVALGHTGMVPVGGGSMFSAEVDPDGDELTVYGIVDGEAEVVHRERYEP